MLIGHQKQWQFLKKSFELGKISHAYLFSGQEKLGKKTLAFEFIKLLNCQNPDFSVRPCQNCRFCQEIQKNQHPDLSLISPIGKEIQISQIRDLIWNLSLHPYSAPFKTAIIDKAHLINQEAQSCFLKTLEEPKGNTILILITEYPEMLLSTILSRIQKIKFYPLPLTEIENFLKMQGASEKEAKGLASLSFGKPGIALDFFRNPKNLENQKQKIADLIKIAAPDSDLAFRFRYAKDFSQEPKNLKEILETWLRYFRNVLISRLNQGSDFKGKTGIFNQYSLSKLKNILKNIQSTIFLISTTNVNPRLALEVLLLKL